MKRRIILSFALMASLTVVALTRSDSTVGAQNQMRPIADSDVIVLGPDQVLRLTVTDGEPGGETVRVRFRQMSYTPDTCNSSGICKNTIASQTTTNPMVLAPGEAASIDIPAAFVGGVYVGVRGVVLSNRRDLRVQGIVFDTSTQRVVAICCTSTTMYWP